MKVTRLCFFLLACTPGLAQSLVPATTGTIAPHFDPVTGAYAAQNYILPSNNNPDYPSFLPWIYSNAVTRRFTFNDAIMGTDINVHYQHGGSNFMGIDTQLKPKAVNGNFENANALWLSLQSNTDVQIGSTMEIDTNHYGHGDTIMFSGTNNATGCSRGADECNKVFRLNAQFRGNNYGIEIASLTTDTMGQAILTPRKNSDGTPLALPGHDLHASMENGPLLNTNPAKVYRAGDVAEVEICPKGTPNAEFYMCVTGDAATQWTARYGTSGLTTLKEDLSDIASDKTDRFAAGPVCADIPVADTSLFHVGSLFTISSEGDNFEQPTVLAIGHGTLHACFAKPHAAGELLTTGGAVGHALSFTNDDIAPHTNPGLDNGNPSTLRLGYPIVASLPGNVMMVWVDGAVSFGAELKSRSFAANTPVLSASFDATLDPATHGLAGWTIHSNGDYHTHSRTHEGADMLPPPAISFAGSSCTVLPTAHTIYVQTGTSQVTVAPVTDTPGNCTSLKVSLQNTYPNPASIYPMLWARSNRDPNFVDSTYFRNIGIGASTDGYMVAGGASPEFATGDPVEFGYWWEQYIASGIGMSTYMGKSRRFGSYFDLSFAGVTATPMMNITNYTNPADYYGTFENGHYAVGLHGEGRMDPPIGYQVNGPVRYSFVSQIPAPRVGGSTDAVGLRFFCGSGPCSRGIWNKYDWILAETKGGGAAGLQYDPTADSLTYRNTHQGLFVTPAGIRTSFVVTLNPGRPVSIDDSVAGDGKGGLRSGTLQPTGIPTPPCDSGHRFMQNPVPGGPGVADRYQVCLKDANDHYAWHDLALTH